MQFNYAWEKFHAAILNLVGAGSQKERLVDACLQITRLMPEDIPEEVMDDFAELMASIKVIEPKSDEGWIQATIDLMDAQALQRATNTIVSIYDRVTRYKEPR